MLGDRPKLNPDRPKSVRLYPALEQIVSREADRLGCSDNELIITAIENELLRLATYRLTYAEGTALLLEGQPQSCTTKSSAVLHDSRRVV